MRKAAFAWSSKRPSQPCLRGVSLLLPNQRGLAHVNILSGNLDSINIAEFQDRAFVPKTPILVTTRDTKLNSNHHVADPVGIPAIRKWFLRVNENEFRPDQYLSQFEDTVLPYELIIDSRSDHISKWIKAHGEEKESEGIVRVLEHLFQSSEGQSFHRFNAPLSFFLQTSKATNPTLKSLYIAQAQIIDLPQKLRSDLPTPEVVHKVGKGDIYDANIWVGLPPTYTPLHKDPNPNLFVQLAGQKLVRMFPPNIGRSIFYNVQRSIGQQASTTFRGPEMMEGLERHALEEAVWSNAAPAEGLEVTVQSGDALFIPEGWWHSIRSVGDGLTASVNWWFR